MWAKKASAFTSRLREEIRDRGARVSHEVEDGSKVARSRGDAGEPKTMRRARDCESLGGECLNFKYQLIPFGLGGAISGWVWARPG